MGPSISTDAKQRPARLLLFAPPKWGKSSWAAYATKPVFLMTRGEDGLLTLLSYGRVPETPHFDDEATTWGMVEDAISYLLTADHDRRTLVLDTVNGAVRLAMERVCEEKYGGNWADFEAFGRGVNVTQPLVTDLVARLENLRQERGMSVILLSHSQVKSQKNPGGGDYDQHQPEIETKLASHLHKWADCILYGGYELNEKKAGQPDKVRVSGAGNRIILTGESAGHLAGNRYGLPRVIRGGQDARQLWDAFAAAMKASRPKPPEQKQQEQRPAAGGANGAANGPAVKPADPTPTPPPAPPSSQDVFELVEAVAAAEGATTDAVLADLYRTLSPDAGCLDDFDGESLAAAAAALRGRLPAPAGRQG